MAFQRLKDAVESVKGAVHTGKWLAGTALALISGATQTQQPPTEPGPLQRYGQEVTDRACASFARGDLPHLGNLPPEGCKRLASKMLPPRAQTLNDAPVNGPAAIVQTGISSPVVSPSRRSAPDFAQRLRTEAFNLAVVSAGTPEKRDTLLQQGFVDIMQDMVRADAWGQMNILLQSNAGTDLRTHAANVLESGAATMQRASALIEDMDDRGGPQTVADRCAYKKASDEFHRSTQAQMYAWLPVHGHLDGGYVELEAKKIDAREAQRRGKDYISGIDCP